MLRSRREDVSLQSKRVGPVQLQQMYNHRPAAGVCLHDSCQRIPRVLEGNSSNIHQTFLFRLLNVLLSKFYSQLLEQDIFCPALFELITVVVCEPSAVGFNMADVDVMKNLPEVCVPLLKAMLTSPYCSRLESSLRAKITRQRYESVVAGGKMSHVRLFFKFF